MNKVTFMAVVAVAVLLTAVAFAQNADAAEALALQQAGRLAEATQAWRAVVQQNPKDAEAFASLGFVLSRQQKYDEAAVAYRKAAALNPALPGLQLNLGLAEFKQGRFRNAITPFHDALTTEPTNVQARALLGMSYYGAGNFPEAAKNLRVAAHAQPGNNELQFTLAQSCLWAKEYSCALDEFRQILMRDPDSATGHVLMGEAFDGLGKTPEAISEFEVAAKAAPQEPNVHFGLGYLYWKSHRYADAERAFQAELALDPNHALSLAYLGDIEMNRKNPEQALAYLRKAVQLKHDLRIAYLDLGTVLAEQKHYEDAVAALQRAAQLDPAEPDVHYRLGRLYQAMGRSAESQKEFAKVRQLHQKSEEDLVRKMSEKPPTIAEGETK